jgi:hypothetical protein
MSSGSGFRRKAMAIALDVHAPARGMTFAALASALATDRVFVSTFHELPLGTEVTIEIALREGTARAHGVVESTRGATTGTPGFVVFFRAASDTDRALIARACGEPSTKGARA